MCPSCDMERDRQNILSFWIVFCPFTHPLTTQKRNILKKSKNGLEILSFYTGVPNMMCSPKIWSVSDKKFYYFGPFFALLPSNSPKNEKFLKNEKKNTWRYHHFTQVYQKSWLYAILLLRYVAFFHNWCNCYFLFWAIFSLLSP